MPGSGDSDSTSAGGRPPNPQTVGGDGLEHGLVLGEYVVESLLGVGGCASVYLARHKVLGRKVALKVLSRELTHSNQMVQRFLREAQVVNRISHPSIADVEAFGTLADGRPYYVMEFLTGLNLAHLVTQRGRLPPAEVLEILEPVCDALAAAHAIGVVHRDVKGSNVMVDDARGRRVVKLLDFGIAKLLHPEPGEQPLTTEYQQLGSPPFMAPEQILGKAVDGRTDLYALGVLLHFMLTGAMPYWSTDPVALFRLHLSAPIPRPSALAPLSGAIDEVVVKAMAKEPADRYPNALALKAALRHAVEASSTAARPATPGSQRQARAVGVHARLAVPEGADDATWEVAAGALATLEAALAAQDFQLLLQTSQDVLGARVLPDEASEAREVVTAAVDLAEHAYAGAAALLVDTSARLTLFVHVADAEIKLGAYGVRIQGGPLTQTDDWPIAAAQGWFATRDALAVRNGDA